MKLKYKLKCKHSGKAYTNIKGYLLTPKGEVETVILDDNTHVLAKNVTFHKFLEVIDNYDVYEGDKATVELTDKYLNDYDEYVDMDKVTIVGTFEELYEEGLYYLVEDGTERVYTYTGKEPKIVKFH